MVVRERSLCGSPVSINKVETEIESKSFRNRLRNRYVAPKRLPSRIFDGFARRARNAAIVRASRVDLFPEELPEVAGCPVDYSTKKLFRTMSGSLY